MVSNIYAPMVELVDTLVLEASASACEFESRLGHQIFPCVAQPGRAPGLGPGGRMFESCHTDQLYDRSDRIQ